MDVLLSILHFMQNYIFSIINTIFLNSVKCLIIRSFDYNYSLQKKARQYIKRK